MKILILQGSPRRKGNTAALLAPAITAARAAGATVEKIELARLDIAGCMECFACQRVEGMPGCAIKDDGPGVLDKMLRSDLILFATPVFCWGPTAQSKAMLDRTYSMFKFKPDGSNTCLLKGKQVALLVTAGGPKDEGADMTSQCFRQWTKYGGAKWRGELLAVSLKDPKTTAADKRLIDRAKRFGAKLAK